MPTSGPGVHHLQIPTAEEKLLLLAVLLNVLEERKEVLPRVFLQPQGFTPLESKGAVSVLPGLLMLRHLLTDHVPHVLLGRSRRKTGGSVQLRRSTGGFGFHTPTCQASSS